MAPARRLRRRGGPGRAGMGSSASKQAPAAAGATTATVARLPRVDVFSAGVVRPACSSTRKPFLKSTRQQSCDEVARDPAGGRLLTFQLAKPGLPRRALAAAGGPPGRRAARGQPCSPPPSSEPPSLRDRRPRGQGPVCLWPTADPAPMGHTGKSTWSSKRHELSTEGGVEPERRRPDAAHFL